MARRNPGGVRAVTRRTVIVAGVPQYSGVAIATGVVPAVAQASVPAIDAYASSVGRRFEAVGEYGSYELTLSSVEPLADGTDARTRFGLMFTAAPATPPAGVYRLTSGAHCEMQDAQLFVAGSVHSRRAPARRLPSSRITGRRP